MTFSVLAFLKHRHDTLLSIAGGRDGTDGEGGEVGGLEGGTAEAVGMVLQC